MKRQEKWFVFNEKFKLETGNKSFTGMALLEKKKNWDKVQSISTEENLAHGYKKFIIWA